MLIKSERAEPGATVSLRFDRDLGPESEVDVAGLGFDVEEKELPIVAWSLYRVATLGNYSSYKVVPRVEWKGDETPVSGSSRVTSLVGNESRPGWSENVLRGPRPLKRHG